VLATVTATDRFGRVEDARRERREVVFGGGGAGGEQGGCRHRERKDRDL
jgi:hypothetical protein